MKKILSLMAVVLTLGLTFSAGDAEAKRLGGSKPMGMQRQMDAPAPKAPPTAAPAQTASAPATAAAAQAQPKRSWMGPLAGLAAGIGLAALASHFGFGEELANLMMMALLAFVVIAAIGYFMRKRAMGQQPSMAGAGAGNHGMQYSAERVEPAGRNFENVGSGGTAATATSAASSKIPADFDTDGFVRNAKVHFIRLQAANDAGNLDDIREFTTPEMFAEIKMNFTERAGAAQETDVVAIDTEVIEVVEEANRYIVSARFTGQIREEKNGPVEAFDEIWHLVKPRNGSGGWLLAGIQQLQ
jgi:predicted lipid-binding transport protein (Tim44 family)